MAFNGENFDKTAAVSRFMKLHQFKEDFPHEYVEWAEYFNGEKLWTMLQNYLSSGREGIVITKKDAPVYFKRTPARVTIKVKKELQDTIDCFFTGRYSAPTRNYTGKEVELWEYWEDARTGKLLPKANYFKQYNAGEMIEPVTKSYYLGLAGSLEIAVMKDGSPYPIGMLSGLSEEIKANPVDFAMKPIVVTAMELDKETGALRHGKFLNFRDDISITDCTYEKIFG